MPMASPPRSGLYNTAEDPLATPRGPSPTSPSKFPGVEAESPLSFKRRVPSKRDGLLTGLLSAQRPGDALSDDARRRAASSTSFRKWSAAFTGRTLSPAGSPRGTSPQRRIASGKGPPLPNEQADIPSALPAISPPAYSTPLPTIPMLVLCISMIGEFLSASTPAAFMFFMVESFMIDGEDKANESEVGLWTGNLASVFFLAQFVTSLLWASAADKHGRRAVLFVSLFGNAVTLVIFGWSTTLGMAFCARAGQGLFNGAVGVARGAVRDITDPSNEGRAYSLLGVCWGLGGIVGPIIGGLLEHPADKYPSLFGSVAVFRRQPYLLPCIASSCFALVGSFLSLCLGYDGGPREGRIRLTGGEKDVETFSRRLFTSIGGTASPTSAVPDAGPSTRLNQRKSFSQVSTTSHFSRGTAYGYAPHSRHVSVGPSVHPSRRPSASQGTQYAPDYDDLDHLQGLNFAQRLLLSNEPAVFSITDVWVAAATREDDQYSVADYDSVFDDDEDEPTTNHDAGDDDMFGYEASVVDSTDELARASSPALPASLAPSAGRNMPKNRISPRRPSEVPASLVTSSYRRTSIPAVYHNLGIERELPSSPVQRPSLVSDAGFFAPQVPNESLVPPTSLASIPEGKPVAPFLSPAVPFPPPIVAEKAPPSIWRQLPLFLIAEYAILALHGTSCDQVFMSFLVTPVRAGGLGLNASHYAELVAVMCFCQIFWQFRFYPSVGPPRGQLSHLAMFRLGLLAYIPVYLLFPTLRFFLHDNTNAFVMIGMILLSALRYLANVCAYTAVMILTNAMTPPHLTPLANGLAQSAASAARFVGPVVGGMIWSWSIAGGPEARPWPFNYYFGFNVIAFMCASGLASSFFLKPPIRRDRSREALQWMAGHPSEVAQKPNLFEEDQQNDAPGNHSRLLAEEQGPLLEGLLDDVRRRESLSVVPDDDFSVLRRRGGGLVAGIANMSNAILGAGIIGLPYAMREAGLITGLILLIGLGAVTDWTIRLIVLNAKLAGSTSYVGIMDTAFGLTGRATCSFFQFAFAFGGCCAFCVIVGDTIPHVLTSLMPALAETSFFGHFLFTRGVVIVVCTVGVSYPLSLYRDIEKLSRASALALISMTIILFSVAIRGPQLSEEYRGFPSARFTFISSGIASAIGVISFAFVCHHNTLLIYGSLREPTMDRFARVTHISTLLSVCASTAMALAGYLVFTDKTQGNVLNNFPPEDSILINVARGCFGLNMFTTMPLEAFVCREVVETFFFDHEPFNVRRHIATTTFIVGGAMIVSLLLNDLGVVLEITGGLGATALAYVMPAAAWLRLSRSSDASKRIPAFASIGFGITIASSVLARAVLRAVPSKQ